MKFVSRMSGGSSAIRCRSSWLEDYDIVIVDCPPNLGIITLNGLRISDGYIIPTIPDHLSTYGIPQIITRISDFSEAISETIEPVGIVATKYQAKLTRPADGQTGALPCSLVLARRELRAANVDGGRIERVLDVRRVEFLDHLDAGAAVLGDLVDVGAFHETHADIGVAKAVNCRYSGTKEASGSLLTPCFGSSCLVAGRGFEPLTFRL
jgi:hypothetical protein